MGAGLPEKKKKDQKVLRPLEQSALQKMNLRDKKIAFAFKKVGTKLYQLSFFFGIKVYQNQFLVQAIKPLALPGLAMQLQARFPYALSLLFAWSVNFSV